MKPGTAANLAIAAALLVSPGFAWADASSDRDQARGDRDGSGVMRFRSTDTPKPIPDFGSLTSTLYVPRNIEIADVNVELDISHTWVEDLVVTLVSPSGTRVRLINGVGGSRDNFTGTVLDDQANTVIRMASPPYRGAFVPEQRLARLNLGNARGNWSLIVDDVLNGDAGTLLKWGLVITPTERGLTAGVLVDFSYSGIERGTREQPFRTVGHAVASQTREDAILLIRPGASPERLRIDRAIVLDVDGKGVVRIGTEDAASETAEDAESAENETSRRSRGGSSEVNVER